MEFGRDFPCGGLGDLDSHMSPPGTGTPPAAGAAKKRGKSGFDVTDLKRSVVTDLRCFEIAQGRLMD